MLCLQNTERRTLHECEKESLCNDSRRPPRQLLFLRNDLGVEVCGNLCAMIPADLHAKVIAEKEQLALSTLGEYVELVLKEHFEGGKTIMAATKTLAFQISEELDQRLKNFIAAEKKRGRKISQKEFVIGLIEQALAEYEAQNQTEETTNE